MKKSIEGEGNTLTLSSWIVGSKGFDRACKIDMWEKKKYVKEGEWPTAAKTQRQLREEAVWGY